MNHPEKMSTVEVTNHNGKRTKDGRGCSVNHRSPAEPLFEDLLAWAMFYNESGRGVISTIDFCNKASDLKKEKLMQCGPSDLPENDLTTEQKESRKKLKLTPKYLEVLENCNLKARWGRKWKSRMLRPCPGSEGAQLLLEFRETVDVSDLVTLLKKDPRVWSIKGNIGDKEGEEISKVLKESKNCKKLALSNNKMTKKAFQSIAGALAQREIPGLSVHQNDNIRGDCIALIAKMTHLTHLYIWDCKLGDAAANILANLLGAKNGSLLELILTRNNIGSEGANAMAKALRKNDESKLECLSLDSNRINSSETPDLLLLLETTKRLKRLHLEKNLIEDRLCFALSENRKSAIWDLQLGTNKITEIGAGYLAKFLEQSGLCALKLTDNNIGDKGAEAVMDSIKKRNSRESMDQTIVELAIMHGSTGMTPDGIKEVMEAGKNLSYLKLVTFELHDRAVLKVPK